MLFVGIFKKLLVFFLIGFFTWVYQTAVPSPPIKVLLICLVGLSAWFYKTAVPPPPKTLGSRNGPRITSPRIKLRDGRHLAYEESGVPKEIARSKLIFVHGFGSSKFRHPFATSASPALVKELEVYFVAIDRPGYGESDPDPNRTHKSLALDIEELADQLELGPKFYVAGWSMGGMVIWSCLKYIPHRLAGAVLISPGVNFWWPHLPLNIRNEAYSRLLKQDQWCYRIAYYLPWLSYWWNTQKWFPSYSVIDLNLDMCSRTDRKLYFDQFTKMDRDQIEVFKSYPTQQGQFESLLRDLNIFFGKWDFDPMDIENPFPNKEGSVHIWMGDEDGIVPVTLQRYIAQQVKWVKYHEVTGEGHLLALVDGLIDDILKALLKEK